MRTPKTIAVVGATGAHGGALVRSILNAMVTLFQARAITRNSGSDKAIELARIGAEVVEANLDDPESLKRAFRGAYGAYCVTNYLEHFSSERELAQVANLARAAKDAGLKHVVWSPLEAPRHLAHLNDDRMPIPLGRNGIPHFNAKGEASRVFTDLGVPTTFLLTSFYWDNFIHFGMGPKRGADGRLAITLPMGDKKLSGIAAVDIGRCAYGIFRSGMKYIGKTVGIAGGHLTGAEMAAHFSDAVGEEVIYNDVSPEAYNGSGFPGAGDLGKMFQFNRDFGDAFCGVRDLNEARLLNPYLQSFEGWLSRNRTSIPVDQVQSTFG